MIRTQIVEKSAYHDSWRLVLAGVAEQVLGLDLGRLQKAVPRASVPLRDSDYETVNSMGIINLRKLTEWCARRRLTEDEKLVVRMLNILAEEHGMDNVGIAVVDLQEKKGQ